MNQSLSRFALLFVALVTLGLCIAAYIRALEESSGHWVKVAERSCEEHKDGLPQFLYLRVDGSARLQHYMERGAGQDGFLSTHYPVYSTSDNRDVVDVVAQTMRTRAEKTIYLQADSDLDYGEMLQRVDALQSKIPGVEIVLITASDERLGCWPPKLRRSLRPRLPVVLPDVR